MNGLKELDISEMRNISGGVNIAYEIGYVIGTGIKHILFLKSLRSLL